MLLRRTRRLLAPLSLLAASALFAACGEQPTAVVRPEPEIIPTQPTLPAAETRAISAPVLSTLHASAPMMVTCAPAVAYTLTDGRMTVGKVSIANDATTLYVTYEITEKDRFISDTRLAVAKTYAKIPQDANKAPMPWSFPNVGEHEPPITSYTYALQLAQIGAVAGENIVIAAMAGVVFPTTASYEGPWEWRVMWGIGSAQGAPYQTAYNYTVARCANAPPPPPPSTTGAVTLTFDDGWLDTYTNAYPVLKEFGLSGNVAVNPLAVDQQWGGYMTLAQLKTLSGAGWSIVSHSVSHRDLTRLNDTELEAELRDSKTWIERNGFGPSNTFIVPFHSWGARERAAVQRHYARARGFSVNQFSPARFTKMPLSTNPYDIYGYEPEFAPFTTAAGRQATMEYVERAVKEGEHVDIFFHHINTADVPAFRELMRQIAAYKASVRTWGQM